MRKHLVPATLAASLSLSAWAEPPPGYYASVNRNTPEDMRRTLHELIDDHVVYPLQSDGVDIWDILLLADEDIDNPGNVITIYKNASYPKQGGPSQQYTFDSAWSSLYGFPIYNEGNIPYTDGHNLFMADVGHKSARNGWTFSSCNFLCTEKPTDVNNGRGGGTGVHPGNSNWIVTRGGRGIWETWVGRRGDVARAAMYMDIRYDGGTHGALGFEEPIMEFPDRDDAFDPDALIQLTRSGKNEEFAYFGYIATMQSWHNDDQVDAIERRHHETVAEFQGNRNPFIDHPEWVACLYQLNCTPFAINQGLSDAWYNPATPGQGFLITVLPTLKLMFVAMFTYDAERPPESTPAVLGEPGHRWITAVGPFSGSTATLAVENVTGGVFASGNPAVGRTPEYGSFEVEFGGCDNATVSYSIPSLALVGEIPIQRVVKDNVPLCESLESAE